MVPSDRSIADVLQEMGIDIPPSCEQGVCGTCLVRVLEGTPDHRDMFQSDEEREAGPKRFGSVHQEGRYETPC